MPKQHTHTHHAALWSFTFVCLFGPLAATHPCEFFLSACLPGHSSRRRQAFAKPLRNLMAQGLGQVSMASYVPWPGPVLSALDLDFPLGLLGRALVWGISFFLVSSSLGARPYYLAGVMNMVLQLRQKIYFRRSQARSSDPTRQ